MDEEYGYVGPQVVELTADPARAVGQAYQRQPQSPQRQQRDIFNDPFFLWWVSHHHEEDDF